MDRLRRVATAGTGDGREAPTMDNGQQARRKRPRETDQGDDAPRKIPKPKGSHGKDWHLNRDYFGLPKDRWLGYTVRV